MPFCRHIDAILHFWPLSEIFRLRRLTFCWRFELTRSYIRKKLAVKSTRGTCQDGVDWWRRWDARGHKLQRCRHQGCQFGLFSAKFVEFGFFENRLAGRKMASRTNCFWPIWAFLKFVVIIVLYEALILPNGTELSSCTLFYGTEWNWHFLRWREYNCW